jgi:hypothetical protein
MSSGIVRENLRYILIGMSQSKLSRMSGGTPTQQHISEVRRCRRYLRDHEVRNIERALGIPSGWLTQFSLRAGAYAYMRLKVFWGSEKIAVDYCQTNSAITLE